MMAAPSVTDTDKETRLAELNDSNVQVLEGTHGKQREQHVRMEQQQSIVDMQSEVHLLWRCKGYIQHICKL